MTTSPAVADRFRHAANRLTSTIAAVAPDQWANASPCEEWTAADIVDHVVSTQHDLLVRMGFPFGPVNLDDARAAWPTVRARMEQALENPAEADHHYDGYFGPTTFAETADTFYAMDLVIHTWDLARAAGLAEFEAIDVAEMDRITSDLSKLGDNVRMPGLFGAAIDVGPDADRQSAFLAFVGRRSSAR